LNGLAFLYVFLFEEGREHCHVKLSVIFNLKLIESRGI